MEPEGRMSDIISDDAARASEDSGRGYQHTTARKRTGNLSTSQQPKQHNSMGRQDSGECPLYHCPDDKVRVCYRPSMH